MVLFLSLFDEVQSPAPVFLKMLSIVGMFDLVCAVLWENVNRRASVVYSSYIRQNLCRSLQLIVM